MQTKPEIDWAKFKEWPRPTLTCECGTVYQSHSKHVWLDGRFVGVSQDPCPGCGAEFDHITRASHPPEVQVIRR